VRRAVTRLIVALDLVESAHEAARIVDGLCGLVAGFKVGIPFILRNCPQSTGRLRSLCPSRLWIADLKLADIGPVMVQTVGLAARAFDAVIAHAFIGYRGALDMLKESLERESKQLILVASMSHPGGSEVYDKALPLIEEVVEKTRPWGLVAPATRPEVVRRLRSRFPWAKILSPGVGAQGAKPGAAICAGADYEIVGRSITGAPDPLAAAERILREQEEAVERCRQS
jgi:orotidine-5'-phosphate decarboxylase